MLERIAVVVETVSLGLWAGAMAGFAFIVAPAAFRTIPTMAAFSAFVGTALRALGNFGTVCGLIAIVAALLRSLDPSAGRFSTIRGTLVGIALAASFYESRVVVPAMDRTAASIPGAIDSVPKNDLRRVAYDAQHNTSTRVYGAAFLCVVAATALAGFGRRNRTA